MDPAKTPLGQKLLDEITPVVMVLSTPLVEEASLKNGLSFLQMLTPFCSFHNIDVPVRTASDQPYRLHKFKLRLFYASDVRKPDLEVAKEHLKEVITEAGEKELSELSLDAPEINHVLESSESGNTPSWLQFFNKELIRVVSFSDHEAFDHPVACLLAVSSKDEQPINRFVDLFNTNKLPSLLNDGVMDPKILKHYLLVHDNQDGPADRYICYFLLASFLFIETCDITPLSILLGIESQLLLYIRRKFLRLYLLCWTMLCDDIHVGMGGLSCLERVPIMLNGIGISIFQEVKHSFV